ncbi:ferredoxin-type protein NapF [Thermopetrobacter sp. TC1]|uniref:ferredoxin-type protein NapF n=1 Tax=Thermopetrobacter sp. TC1 TaxID=1495045 RepID=UPI0006907420|nr:ferredoxin-type protein NapF [Thermopetrobacter sp. TC1]
MSRRLTRRELFASLTGDAIRRPPGAVCEAEFLERCDGCGRCIEVCAAETGVLKPDRAGAPLLDFARGHCTFCALCVKSCPTGALKNAEAVEWREWAFPWHMSIDEAACLEFTGTTCRMCESACEDAAIHFRPLPGFRTRAWIEAAECTGCGECLARCPQQAIRIIERTAGEGGIVPAGDQENLSGNGERAA